MLTALQKRLASREGCIDWGDDDGPSTLERYISVGNPTIVASELRGREAASTALEELAAADGWDDRDDPVTQERVVRAYTHDDFDDALIDALIALERGEDTIVFDTPIDVSELQLIDRLREPYVDFQSLASW